MKAKRLTKGQEKGLRYRNAKLLDSSRSVYAEAVKGYFSFLIGNGLSEEFDVENIREWLKQYRNPHTYNIRLQGIKEYYLKQYAEKSAVKRLKMREDFETIRRKHPSYAQLRGIDYLSRHEIERLSRKTTSRTGSIILSLFWTGCRISELINIKLNDCSYGDPVLIRIVGKGLKERYVYLPLSEYLSILRIFESKEYLFETRKGQQMSRCFISHEILRQSRAKMGISVHAHTMRHSKAMYLKDKGLTADQIARALGHINVTTTLTHYLHGTPSAKEQGIPIKEKKQKEA